MRLWIAEKPSVARAIANALGITSRDANCITCSNNNTVTWCFGHMLELESPDYYLSDDVPEKKNGNGKLWRMQDLPIVPAVWKHVVKKEAAAQLKMIKKLLSSADEVVNCGDPDREGQLLVDEILEEYHCKAKVKRYWCNAVDDISVRRAVADLRDNSDYTGMRDAARARACADWLVGMNMTRAMTVASGRLVTVGRVQSPTLNLVVERDKAIENFQPSPYFNLFAVFSSGGSSFRAKFVPEEGMAGLDAEGRLIDEAAAKNIADAVKAGKAAVAGYEHALKKSAQPLALSLSDMQSEASARWGYGAEEVLNTVQALYEKKLLSYPRTDCRYLPTVQQADIGKVLSAIAGTADSLKDAVKDADSSIRTAVWNDSKTTAHHAIVPTSTSGTLGSEKERNIYTLAAERYLAQFYPAAEYYDTKITVTASGNKFTASGKTPVKAGWQAVTKSAAAKNREKDDDSGEESQTLPELMEGQSLTCSNTEVKTAKTKPPKRFTEGTLIRAMENIAQYADDPTSKKILKDGDGIGTSATRAGIISELKTRGFLETQGKNIVSTEVGRAAAAAISPRFRTPALTAVFEKMMTEIEQGTKTIQIFIDSQVRVIRQELDELSRKKITMPAEKRKPAGAMRRPGRTGKRK